ncbi:hypothetical protein P7E02_24385 [Enterococcus hulanensis]|uniref:hypothetical protein n=1 Tax=Enterococcus hulanensis TaxID=2559929 RepID=UPI00288E2C05|nr:hypothetical protein [Enterococcus hulanensis]MDT2663022.1 hypothetical protein [Enterococcus hulanensis]
MGRKRRCRYSLQFGESKIVLSLLKEFCDRSTEAEIARVILIHFRMFNVLNKLDSGKLNYSLKKIDRKTVNV